MFPRVAFVVSSLRLSVATLSQSCSSVNSKKNSCSVTGDSLDIITVDPASFNVISRRRRTCVQIDPGGD